MSRCRLAVTKDRYSWAVCGPWTDRGDIPWPWGPSTAPTECRHRGEPHLHIYFSSWGHAMFAARLILPGSTLNLRVKVEG